MRLVITVVLSLAAAAVFGFTSVLEQRNTKKVPKRGALAPRLLYDLLRRPSFVAAFALNLVGNILQILALHVGSLAVVQPLIVLNLLFAVLIASFTMRHRPPDRTLFAGALCCCAGIGWFLAAARPGGGSAAIGTGPAVPLGLGVAAALSACLAAARWGPVTARPLASGRLAIGSEAASLAMMTAGIFALAHRAPHVVQQQTTPELAPEGRQASE